MICGFLGGPCLWGPLTISLYVNAYYIKIDKAR